MSYERIRYVYRQPLTTMVPIPVAVSSYAGPGDVVAAADNWWGLRAFSQATAGSNTVRLRRTSDDAQSDFATNSLTGGLSISAINTFAGGSSALYVVTLYDQVGATNLTQASTTDQPLFITNGAGAGSSLPVIRGSSTFTWLQAANPAAQSQPFTFSWMAKRTGDFTTQADMVEWNAVETGFQNVADTVFLIRPAAATVTAVASDTTWHAVQSVYNGANTDMNVDGVVDIGALGSTAGINAGGNILLGAGSGPFAALRGDYVEFGLWATAFSSAQSDSMSANQHSYWGV